MTTDSLRLEIEEQPSGIAGLLDGQWDAVEGVAAAVRRRDPAVVVLVGRGSSDHAAIYGKYLLEICNGYVVALAAPSTLTLYGDAPRLGNALVVGVSQSGQGEDVVAYVAEARRQGAMTVAIVNDPQSPLAHTAETTLDCLAGPELSVPATKTVTAEMTLFAMLSAALSDDAANRLAQLRAVPEALERGLDARNQAARMAEQLAPLDLASVIGRGFAFPVALETALKLKETSYTRAEPFSAADFQHGPRALVQAGYASVLIDVGGRSSGAALDAAVGIQQRGGHPFLLRAGELDGAASNVPVVAVSAPIPEPYAPILGVVLGQLLAVELAAERGLDPAHPRGLSKVTSTR